MGVTTLIIQLLSGAVGGNIVGGLFRKLDLGIPVNSLAGIVGGLVGGHFFQDLFGANSGGDLDAQNVLGSFAGGGVGGTLLMAIIGWIIKGQKEEP